MPRAVPGRLQRRRVFLRSLAGGETVVAASQASGLRLATLYLWRRKDESFRLGWDEAAKVGAEALAARIQSEVVRRAVEGVDETVYHAGEPVGTRKRYSDPLLMLSLREFTPGKAERPPRPAALPPPDENRRITVVVREFGPPPERVAPEKGAEKALPVPEKERGDE